MRTSEKLMMAIEEAQYKARRRLAGEYEADEAARLYARLRRYASRNGLDVSTVAVYGDSGGLPNKYGWGGESTFFTLTGGEITAGRGYARRASGGDYGRLQGKILCPPGKKAADFPPLTGGKEPQKYGGYLIFTYYL